MAELWMRSSRLETSGFQIKRYWYNATVLVSIPACCDTLESEGRHIKQICWLKVFTNVRGASKIKLKNVSKKRMATARRLIFFGISRGIHC